MRRPVLRARRALIVAPHPDDEAIGAWALMRRLVRNGTQVRVVVVSDGAASHPGSERWPRGRLIAERRRETARAMATLRIPPSRLRFLMLPDGGLCRDAVATAIRRDLKRASAPDLIVGPVADDAHADHRAVAAALARLPRRGERRLAYRVWPAGGRRSARAWWIGLDGVARAAKRRAIRSYRTQTGTITDAVAGFTMTARHLDAFVRPSERFEVLA